jgi:hypothetical protein
VIALANSWQDRAANRQAMSNNSVFICGGGREVQSCRDLHGPSASVFFTKTKKVAIYDSSIRPPV